MWLNLKHRLRNSSKGGCRRERTRKKGGFGGNAECAFLPGVVVFGFLLFKESKVCRIRVRAWKIVTVSQHHVCALRWVKIPVIFGGLYAGSSNAVSRRLLPAVPRALCVTPTESDTQHLQDAGRTINKLHWIELHEPCNRKNGLLTAPPAALPSRP